MNPADQIAYVKLKNDRTATLDESPSAGKEYLRVCRAVVRPCMASY